MRCIFISVFGTTVLTYLKNHSFNVGPLGQEVQHGEARVGADGCHADPVAPGAAGSDVVWEARQVLHEQVGPSLHQAGHVESEEFTPAGVSGSPTGSEQVLTKPRT